MTYGMCEIIGALPMRRIACILRLGEWYHWPITEVRMLLRRRESRNGSAIDAEHVLAASSKIVTPVLLFSGRKETMGGPEMDSLMGKPKAVTFDGCSFACDVHA